MTFDEWMRSHEPKHCDSDDSMSLRLLRKCWDNAKQDEREQCAKVCDDIAHKPSNTVLGIALKCADAIRARKD